MAVVHIVLILVIGGQMNGLVVFLRLVVDMMYHLASGLVSVLVLHECHHSDILLANRKRHHMDDKWIEELIRLLKQ